MTKQVLHEKQVLRPDGIVSGLDGHGVHHSVKIPTSWEGRFVEILTMISGPGDEGTIRFSPSGNSLDVGFIMAPRCADELRELARMLNAMADVQEEADHCEAPDPADDHGPLACPGCGGMCARACR